ncbi:MAG: hypothetical protein ABUK01_08040 [Leptospirales bacterium]
MKNKIIILLLPLALFMCTVPPADLNSTEAEEKIETILEQFTVKRLQQNLSSKEQPENNQDILIQVAVENNLNPNQVFAALKKVHPEIYKRLFGE